MIVKPKVRGFICTTAHAKGCEENVKSQIEFAKSSEKTDGAKKVLIIGASTGYGLASRIASTFTSGASTIGIIFDKEASATRPASAGWYNTASFEKLAAQEGYYAKSINGDAFSKEIKQQTIDLIKKDLGKVDLVVYSLASPRRTTEDGTTYSSVLKTTGQPYTNKTIDLKNKQISDITIPQATQEEIDHTIKVMGGEDWAEWIDELFKADAIEDNATTVAYSYIGPVITHPMYLNGSIGKAKEDLYNTANNLTQKYSTKAIKAYISVNKALVTQSSAAIPIVPLYISILYKVMKDMGNHEGCIEQICRMYHDKLFTPNPVVDDMGRLRPDDLEMQADVQSAVMEIWNKIDMFGFDIANVDYDEDIDIDVKIGSID